VPISTGESLPKRIEERGCGAFEVSCPAAEVRLALRERRENQIHPKREDESELNG
jgi:hypothetical protein